MSCLPYIGAYFVNNNLLFLTFNIHKTNFGNQKKRNFSLFYRINKQIKTIEERFLKLRGTCNFRAMYLHSLLVLAISMQCFHVS